MSGHVCRADAGQALLLVLLFFFQLPYQSMTHIMPHVCTCETLLLVLRIIGILACPCSSVAVNQATKCMNKLKV